MTFYDELEVSPHASAEVIKSAHRSLLIRFHPDRHPGDKEAEARIRRVNEAYSVLSDETKRRAYDEELALGGPEAGDGASVGESPRSSVRGAVGAAEVAAPKKKRRFSRPFALGIFALSLVAVAMWVKAARTIRRNEKATAEQAAMLSAMASARSDLSLDDRLTMANACRPFQQKSDLDGLRKCREAQVAIAASTQPPNLQGASPDVIEKARRECDSFRMRGDLAGLRACFKAQLQRQP